MGEIWIAVAGSAVAGAYAADSASKDKKDDRKAAEEMSELGFQRQRWLNEQARAFQLEDRQYTEDNIAGFRGFAPKESLTFNGQPVVNPTRTDTSGLANFNPNQQGLMNEFGELDRDGRLIDPSKKPLMRSANGY